MIELPRIAVLGMQSSGKSSVLESIIGYGFLPRGEGLVTRRPLEMRLKHLSDPNSTPYVVFEADKGKKITDFSKVTTRIEQLTDDVAGTNKGIVDDPIKMQVFAHSCPDLTLVDLPGITLVPLKGSSQKQNIEKVTKGMCIKYCAQERTIILCVCQGNVDISTLISLQMVGELDPEGERTLGVLTKVDIMNQGTNAVKVLRGDEVDLHHGFVAVKGRSQTQISSGMTISEALEMEQEYFEDHPEYSQLSNGKEVLGIPALVNKISTIMNRHIKKSLPSIIEEIKIMVDESEKALGKHGEPMPQGKENKLQKIWKMVHKYVKAYENTIKGKYSKLENEDSSGVQVRTLFKNIFIEVFEGKKDLSDYLTDREIEQAFVNYEGNSFPGMPTYGGFLSLLHPFIDRLYAPADEIVDQIYSNLENSSKKLIQNIFNRFPGLDELVTNLSSKVLSSQRSSAKKMVHSLLNAEKGYIFTSNLEFHQNFGSLLPVSLYTI